MSEIAVLMAAGLGTRMYPLTAKIPKPLIEVNGKPMIETLIEGLVHRGVSDIYVVTGYLSHEFDYLKDKYSNLRCVYNPYHMIMNNVSSIEAVGEILRTTQSDVFICESDLYVSDETIFSIDFKKSCYFGKKIEGHSDDWVFDCDNNGRITRVGLCGDDAFNMTGVSWFRNEDVKKLMSYIDTACLTNDCKCMFWDEVVNLHLDSLDLIVQPIGLNCIRELDTIDDLIKLDDTYKEYQK